MAEFILLHCHHDSDTYRGHRVVDITASDYDDAKRQAHDILTARWSDEPWEYRLLEVTKDSGSRLHKRDEISWLVGSEY